jgi:tetratricopeptide (TPR) repeat protein
MTGRFNIAVAEFAPVGGVDPAVAETVSQQVFRFLDDQANQISFEDVQVSNTNIGQITSAQQARSLARRINAQVVIYGDVSPLGDQVLLTPQFYVAEAFRADVGELNGQQKLAEPITLPQQGLTPNSDPVKLLQERTVIMTQFTKTLVYLAVDDLPLAREAIRQAIKHGEQQDPFEGQEVLYLFASEIARLQKDQASAQTFVDQALNLNPEYGRGFIAKANIYYDEGNLYQAVEYYRKAKGQPDQPYGAYIPEKANLGIGNSCWLQLQYVLQNSEPDPIGSAELEQCALQHYQEVIDFYKEQKEPETNVKEMAAWAYYSIATLLREPGQSVEAQRMYQEALRLTSNQELINRVNARLKEVKE